MDEQKRDTYAQFYVHPQLQGDGNYKDVILAEIFIMGNKNTSISKPVFGLDEKPIEYQGQTLIDKYPRAWAAFRREDGAELDGDPLRNLAGVGPGQIRNLENMGIETIEDLANLADNVVIGESGMLDLRKKAQAYIAAMHPEKLEAERQASEERAQEQANQINNLQEQLAALQAKLEEKPKPRGRPKRNESA